MATAHIKTADGTTIRVNGTADEITAVVQRLKADAAGDGGGKKAKKQRLGGRQGLSELIDSEIEKGFFNKPIDLGTLKAKLEEMGHHYPLTTLSPTMLRLVRQRQLRRVKKDNRWHYTR